MKRAYIAGRITGLDRDNVIQKFNNKELQLIEAGLLPVNPVSLIGMLNILRLREGKELLKDNDKYGRWEIMRICFKALLNCDELHMLHDWNDSPGAWQERELAMRCGIEIVYP